MATELTAGDHTADVGIATLQYRVAGNGPALIVQPGGAGWGGDAAAYPSVLAPLESMYTVVYLEPRGFGGSSGPADRSFSIDSYADDIESLRTYLGLERFTLLGHSHGGFVALRFALRHPEVLDRLILVDSAPTLQLGDRPSWIASRPGAADVFARIAEISGRVDDPDLLHRETIELLAPLIHLHDRELAGPAFTEFLSRTGFRSAPYAQFVSGEAGTFDLRPGLAELRVPTLVIVGDDESPELEQGSRLIADVVPGAQLEIIENCGHWPFIEQPAAFFAALGDAPDAGPAAESS